MRTKPADQSVLIASILLQLRGKHASSRSSLAAVTRLSPSTVGIYVDHLIALGYVTESGLEQGPMGRPKRRLGLVENAGWFAGVEFNAERIQAVRVNFAGQQTAAVVRPLPADADARQVVEEIRRSVRELGQDAPGLLMSMGLGAPGLVDPAAGVALHYSFIPGWNKVPLVSELKQHFPVGITLENNLRAIALAERWFGGGRELEDYVILGPRSGFGIAIMKNGQLIRGAHHAAGEIGRWPWPVGNENGEVHDNLTAPAIWRRLSAAKANAALPTDLHAAMHKLAAEHGPARQAVVQDYARVLGMLHLLLDPQTYFLHGPLTALGLPFCQEITQETVRLIPALKEMPPVIVPSSLGDEAGALGAASLGMEAWIPDLNPKPL